MPRFGRNGRFFDSTSGSEDDSDSSSDLPPTSRHFMAAQVKLNTAEPAQTKPLPNVAPQSEHGHWQSTRAPSPSRPSGQIIPTPATPEKSSSTREIQSDLTVQDLWDAAEENFMSLTGVPLRVKSDSCMQHVMSRLEAKYGSDAKGKGNKTKKVVRNVIEVIKNLGAIAAQGAAMVFGPADLCFNAVSFLLDIPAKIDKVFGSVGDLFERLHDYLMKLEIYKRIERETKVPQSLLYFTNVVLTKFVDVCALAYGLAFGSKAAKAKAAFLAVVANDDSGISGALKDFDSLVARQASLESSENLAAALSAAKNTQQIPAMASNVTDIRSGVDMLVSAQNSRSVDRYFHEQRDMIAQKLGIEKNAIREQDELMRNIRVGLRNSGSELTADGDYRKWASFVSDVKPAIFLSGEQRYGRSYLIDAIINDMESRSASDHESNTGYTFIVGYYIFQRKDERNLRGSEKDNAETKRPVETALKHICLQIASRTKAYTREVSTLLQTLDVNTRSATEMWHDLGIGRPRSDTVHLLVFDGIDQISESQAEMLFRIIETLHRARDEHSSAFIARSRVRILVGGVEKSFPTTFLRDVPVLSVVSLNTSNLKTLIDQRINGDEFKDAIGNDDSVKQWIQENLPEASNGDFSKVQRALESLRMAIKDGDDIEQAKQALLDACDEDPSLVASNIIQDLSKSLSLPDVKRLNVLLTWTVYGLGVFTLEELKALSYLSTGDNPYLPFHQIVKTKYFKVFDISEKLDQVIIKPVVEDLFRQQELRRSPQASHSAPKEAKISLDIKIQNASISQVKRFLWTLNEQVNFDASLFQAAGSQIADKSIEVYEADALLMITLKCLDFLNDEVDELTAPLLNYVIMTLNDHLDNLWYIYKVRNLISVEEVKQVQSALIAFLSDVDMLDKHKLHGGPMRKYWLDESRGKEHIIHVWLTATEGIQLLDRRDKRLLGILMDEKEGPWGFYKPITMLMVKRWLQSSDYRVEQIWDWIDVYVEQVWEWVDGHDGRTKAHAIIDGSASGTESRPRSSAGSVQSDRVGAIGSPDGSDRQGRADRPTSATSEWSIWDGRGSGEPSKLSEGEIVERAIRWATKHLGRYETNALWYKKIGDTYKLVEEYPAAINAYEEAKRLDPDDWMLYGDAAEAHAHNSKWKEAIAQMSQGLEMAKQKDGVDLKTEKAFMPGLTCLIDWLTKDEDFEEAAKQAEIGLSIDPYSPALQARMIDALKEGQRTTKKLRKFIQESLSKPFEDKKYSKLVNIISLIGRRWLEDGGKDYRTSLVTAVQHADLVSELLDAIRQADSAMDDEERKGFPLYRRICLLFEAWVLTVRDGPGDLTLAADVATKALVTDEEGEDGSKWWSGPENEDALQILRQMETVIAASYHMLVMNSVKAGNLNVDQELNKLRLLVTNPRRLPEPSLDHGGLKFYLCSIVAAGRIEKDRELVFPVLELACEMLSNDTPDDDLDAYYTLAQIFASLNDEYNCRVAWSLYAPFDAHVGLEPEHVEAYDVGEGFNVRPHGQGLEPITEDEEVEQTPKTPVNKKAIIKDAVTSENSQPEDATNTVNNNHNPSTGTTEAENADSEGAPPDADADADADADTDTPSSDQPATSETLLVSPDRPSPLKIVIPATTSTPTNQRPEIDTREGEELAQSGIDSPRDNEDLTPTKRPTYIRSRREHISPTTANTFRVPWVFDAIDEDYIIIKQYINPALQRKMFTHTKNLIQSNAWFELVCLGDCDRAWMYASDLYMCRYCQDTIICPDCLKQVQKGDLKPIGVCHPNHDWIYIPHWSNEYFRQVGKGNVRVGGTIGSGGYIEGGDVVDWRVWLNSVRQGWGLPDIQKWKDDLASMAEKEKEKEKEKGKKQPAAQSEFARSLNNLVSHVAGGNSGPQR